MREWTGKRYWLVGASEGLGAALARRLSKAGVELILSARSEESLRALADGLPSRSQVEVVDVTDAEALETVAERIGEIDGVIQVAGAYWPFGAQDWDAERANTMADVNFTGAMRLAGVVVPRFVARDRGHFVLTGSLSGYRGLPGAAAYVSSKAGVMVLAQSLYADLRKTGVQVQLLVPGYIKTRLTEKNDFTMPFIMEPEKAAEICFRHMSGQGFQRAFPRGFSWLFRGSRFLPDWLYYRLFA
ncbi:SDR family NAD(P)-dependent oxidoreductase [Mameliella alba]|uniref:SDR family NAD(P)-dependent oxidoreductase n=1 Tax=Mameliella alba TaxID=561184 RepID=UPI000B5342E5|nr:SDR family NAD(P)-dependent oxidoreductase [Mameliella alba]OWV39771.1 short-chain dehydrogenase [Mameliella alba]OWV55657.1 short-chain dehydrogenase [Mameliella alba]